MLTRDEKYINKVVLETPALITLNEAKILFDLAKTVPSRGVVVEIGSYKGGSTILLAKGTKIAGREKVYSIDSFMDYDEMKPWWNGKKVPKHASNIFWSNIKRAKLDDWVVPIYMTSEDASVGWDKPIRLLWIDGGHDYCQVRKDFFLWEKYMVEGGFVVFHDTCDSESKASATGMPFKKILGPALVVREFILSSKRWGNIKTVDSITYAQKIRHATNIDVLKNNLMTPVFKSIYLFEEHKKILDRFIGKLGLILLHYFPSLYFFIKNTRSK